MKSVISSMGPTYALLLLLSLLIGSAGASGKGHSLISSSSRDSSTVWNSFLSLSTRRRRLAQSDASSTSKYTQASSYTDSDLQTSPSLQAMASVVQSRTWYEGLQVCWAVDSTNSSGFRDTASCQKTLTTSALQLGNAVLSNFTSSTELCDRKSRPKVSLPMLLSNPTSMMGLYMINLDLWSKNSDVIPSIWIGPTAPDAATTLDECGNVITSGGTQPPADPSTQEAAASGQSAEKVKKNTGSLVAPGKGFYAGFVDVAAKTYKEGYAKGASNWMNGEIGVQAPGTGLPVGLTYPQNIFLFMYRKDWFDALKIQPPNTWSELLSLAAALSKHPQFIKTVGSETGAGTTNWDQTVVFGADQEQPFTDVIAKANAIVPGSNPRPEMNAWPDAGAPARVFHQAHFFGQTPENNTDSRLKRKLQEDLASAPAAPEPDLIPLCLDLAPYCKSGDYLAAISASIIQSQGIQQGYLLDPNTLEPLSNSPGFKLAAVIFKELVALSLPLKPMSNYQPMTTCEAISRPFAQGKCAMTIEWDVVWPYVYNFAFTSNASYAELAGNLGISPLPGSGVIWNRASNQLEQCDSDLCPWSHYHNVSQYKAETVAAAGDTTKRFAPDMLSASTSRRWVNRAPYVANFDREGWVCNPEDYMEKLDYTLQAFDAAIRRTTESKRALSGLMKAIFLRVTQKRQGVTSPPPAASNNASVNTTNSTATPTANSTNTAVPAVSVYGGPPVYPAVYGGPAVPPTYGGRRLNWKLSGDITSDPTDAKSLLAPKKRSMLQNGPAMTKYPALNKIAYEIGTSGPPPIPELNTTLAELVQTMQDKLSLKPILFADVQRLLQTLWQIQFVLTPNTATQPVLTPATSGAFVQSFFEAAHYLVTVRNATLSNTAAGLAHRLKWGLTLEPGGLADVTNALWQVTGYQPPPSPPPVLPPAIVVNQQDERAGFPLAGIIAIPVVVTVLIGLLAAGLLAYSRRSRYLSWKGDVLPPGAGSGTTLLYTDIQDSLMLWDSLSPDVVNDAVSLYHSIIRSAAASHHGYECSIEGDSVVLAFHTARAAALFAVDIQHDLLLSRWPNELLALEICKPVWVRPQGKNGKKSKLGKMKGPGSTLDTSLDHQGPAEEDPSGLMPPPQRVESHIGWWRAKNFSRVSMEASMSLQSPMSKTAPNSGGSIVVAHLDDPFYAAGSSPLEWTALTSKLSLTADLTYLQPVEACPSIVSIQTGGVNEDAGSDDDHEETFVRDKLLQLAPLAQFGGPNCILLFRGLRVSIGMASGVSRADDITTNASGRVIYGGPVANIAKAAQAAAPGGQVLAAMSTFVQLPLEDMRGQVVAMEMGEHQLQDVPDTLHLYQLLAPNLMFRAAHFNPVQSVSQESLGAPQAPCNQVAAAFMNIVGMSLLKATDSALAAASIKVFQKVSESHLARLGGYLQMSSDGLCLTAFSHPAEAVRWALDTIEACLEANWPEALLEHELGEVLKVPIMATHLTPGADVMASTPNTPLMTSQRTSVKRMGTRTSAPLELDERGSPLTTKARSSKQSSTFGEAETPGTRASVDGDFDRTTRGDYGRGKKWPMVVHKVVLRGLRMKCGIDYGAVRSGIHGVTARITYSGKVLNRAARVSQTAKTGQVWLTEAAWAVAKHEINIVPEVFDDELPVDSPPEVAATHLGAFKLKGVTDELNLVQCFFCDSGRNVQPTAGFSRYSNPIIEGADE